MRDDQWQQAFDAGRAEADGLAESLIIAEMTMRLDGARLRECGRTTHQSDHALAIDRTALAKYRDQK